MKIVILDGKVVNPGDLSWNVISDLGSLTIHDWTADTEIMARANDADVILTSKVVLSRSVLENLPKLKLICLLATGYNNIDLSVASELGIKVCNAVGYGSPAVAQHVFALILHFANHIAGHSRDVNSGGWTKANQWCYWNEPLVELKDKTLGIYGFGKIGNKVADIAFGFDMNVIAHHKHPVRDARDNVNFVDLETMCRESDFISLHAPLSESNKGIFNKDLFTIMKSSAVLINTGRGGLVNEEDLKDALENEVIRGAGLDVISQEPPSEDHILVGVKNCIITPHHAWAAKNSRQRLIEIVAKNIKAFNNGSPINTVN